MKKHPVKRTISLVLLLSMIAGVRAMPNTDYAAFIAGVILIKSSSFSEEQKTLKYKELLKVSGISSHQALKFIESYRENPQGWRKVQELIRKTTEDSVASLR